MVRGDLVLDTPEGPLLFRTAARTGRPRLTGALVGWYLVVALLDTLWDASRPMAVWLTLLLAAGAGPGARPSRPPGHPPLLKAAKPSQRPHCGPRLAATR